MSTIYRFNNDYVKNPEVKISDDDGRGVVTISFNSTSEEDVIIELENLITHKVRTTKEKMSTYTKYTIRIDKFSRIRILNLDNEVLMNGIFTLEKRNKILFETKLNERCVSLYTNNNEQFKQCVSSLNIEADFFYYLYKDRRYPLSALPFQDSNQSDYLITNIQALKQFRLQVRKPYDILFEIVSKENEKF